MTVTAMKSLSLFAVAALLAGTSLTALAQTSGASSTMMPRLAEAEKKFIKDFVDQHLVEQDIVNKARGKEQAAMRDQKPSPLSPAVSGVQKKMFNELTSSWTEIATIAQNKKVEIPTAAKPKDLQDSMAMGKLTGDKFDKEFLKVVGKEAKKTDMVLTTAGKSVRDADLKAFIDKWAPAFKAHVTDIDAAEKALKAK